MSSPGQIDAYISPEDNVTMQHPEDGEYDFVVYRQHAEYKYILHNPGSVNIYQQRFEELNKNITYIKIYHNPSFYIFLFIEGH